MRQKAAVRLGSDLDDLPFERGIDGNEVLTVRGDDGGTMVPSDEHHLDVYDVAIPACADHDADALCRFGIERNLDAVLWLQPKQRGDSSLPTGSATPDLRQCGVRNDETCLTRPDPQQQGGQGGSASFECDQRTSVESERVHLSRPTHAASPAFPAFASRRARLAFVIAASTQV